MKTARAVFLTGLEQIGSFLDRWDHEQALIALLNDRRTTLQPHVIDRLQAVLETSTNAKQYVYAVAIVSLYGLIERLVDSLVSRYILSLAEFGSRYDQLPEAVTNKHFRKSWDLADAIERGTYYGNLTPSQIIANLHSCFSGATSYTLNGEAFSFHRGNVSLARMQDMLTGIGVKPLWRRLSLTPAFLNFQAQIDPERDIRSIADGDLEGLFAPIEDLVQRRNGISHGMLEVDQIEAVDLLRSRVEFVRAFGASLFELLDQDRLKYAADVGVALRLGQPIAVYNHRIVCFEADCGIAVGDQILALTGEEREPVRTGEVLTLQVNNVDQQAIDAGQRVQFGVGIDFRANESHNYFVLRRSRA